MNFLVQDSRSAPRLARFVNIMPPKAAETKQISDNRVSPKFKGM